MLFLGIDIGGNSANAVVADEHGEVIAFSKCGYLSAGIPMRGGRHEQHPKVWWIAAVNLTGKCLEQIKEKGYRAEDIGAVSCNGTSGTVFLADENGEPLTNALVFDDTRALPETDHLHRVFGDYEKKRGILFQPSYGLPKILWMKKNMPEEFDKCRYIMHPADYLLKKLTGKTGISDYASCLKSGYDIVDGDFAPIIEKIGIDRERLPEVAAPGTVIGSLSKSAAEELGLSESTLAAAGATDGYTGGLCGGANEPGRWTSILGNTFSLKGITKDYVYDSKGRIYCHKLPGGNYMPSGMSNTGGKCLEDVFGRDNLSKFDASVLGLIPTGTLVYPLNSEGEHFPFVKSTARKFVIGYGDEREMYTAHLEGMAYVEKLAIETMEKLGCRIGRDLFAVGGSTKGKAWLKIRATVLNRNLHIPKFPEPAMGSAMLAASGTAYSSLEEASAAMFSEAEIVTPYPDFVFQYERLYLEFKDKCSSLFSVNL